ncbi:HAD family hydrolase [Saccharolobus islandicus]|uniref:HAD-superfamily hydrolase, subfamily IA, variant 3 n=4 Tax=Saccharolobus islandicus TaxID=43080 RepID=F0NF80_SACI5|nr:HAD family phosphatase [Sulfolobus islandicus]ACP38373.1 HAD-superfamily hydrolase, subfamily IA, variant3 [Sulfolobus islandicus M.14.25]ACP55615.1 HAD-superfamily hydrolase, subfamily IA, variant 3 [Sulfolobus islandicus M.16.27]ACR42275.1 HAD-superfamily hydrolase, subfamily IA, variant3 [Sulfolobus islandicus M.16.4]ADX85584.1 HAD-superfamily hydrolase, subfamily IA, variant 3 [Sulfolobus islandicus REY15A]
MRKAVIFDLDGTLANTDEVHKLAWEIALRKLGYDVKVDIRYLLGRKTIDIAKILIGESHAEKLASVKTEIYNELVKTLAKPKPCVMELINRLRDVEIPIAVVTSSMRNSAVQVLKVINVEPDVLITGDDVKLGKPNPMPVIEAIKRLSVDPNESVGVGDTIYDVMAYYSAGIREIIVVRSSVPLNVEEARKYDAKILDSLCEISDWFELF